MVTQSFTVKEVGIKVESKNNSSVCPTVQPANNSWEIKDFNIARSFQEQMLRNVMMVKM